METAGSAAAIPLTAICNVEMALLRVQEASKDKDALILDEGARQAQRKAVDALEAALPSAPHGIDALPTTLQQRILASYPGALLWFQPANIVTLPAAIVTECLQVEPRLLEQLPLQVLKALLPYLIDVIRMCPRALRFLPPALMAETPHLIDLALVAAPTVLDCIPEDLRTEARCRDAVARDPRTMKHVPNMNLLRLLPYIPIEVAATNARALPLLRLEALMKVPVAVNKAILDDPVTAMRHVPPELCMRYPALLWNALFGQGAAVDLYDMPWTKTHEPGTLDLCRSVVRLVLTRVWSHSKQHRSIAHQVVRCDVNAIWDMPLPFMISPDASLLLAEARLASRRRYGLYPKVALMLVSPSSRSDFMMMAEDATMRDSGRGLALTRASHWEKDAQGTDSAFLDAFQEKSVPTLQELLSTASRMEYCH